MDTEQRYVATESGAGDGAFRFGGNDGSSHWILRHSIARASESPSDHELRIWLTDGTSLVVAVVDSDPESLFETYHTLCDDFSRAMGCKLVRA